VKLHKSLHCIFQSVYASSRSEAVSGSLFSSVGHKDNVTSDIGDDCVDTEIPSLNFVPSLLAAKLIDECIKSIKLGKASGPDDLTVEHMLTQFRLYIQLYFAKRQQTYK